jgi:PPK2 family polyphosphate:nucleotide phosphotransferase
MSDAELEKFVAKFRVEPGKEVNLRKDFDPGDTASYESKPANADDLLKDGIELLAEYQDRLYAENTRSLLVIFQALDAAGKDSIIKHVLSGVNPTGCQVTSFKAPSVEELDHDYLWRNVKALPARGIIGIFNRSHYEEVLVVRIHPAFLTGQRLPPDTLGEGLWPMRFAQINDFEQHLVQNGTEVVKIYLNVSKEEQRQRQLERIDIPEKNWKFNAGDIEERKYWDQYLAAYEDVFSSTSTPWAPWYVIPADNKWFTRLAAAAIIGQKLRLMNPQYPTVSEADRQEMLACREVLMAEGGESVAASAPDGATKSSKKGKGKKAGKKKSPAAAK